MMLAAVQVGATCKHFAAYSLENADGYSRLSFNASVSHRQVILLTLMAAVFYAHTFT